MEWKDHGRKQSHFRDDSDTSGDGSRDQQHNSAGQGGPPVRPRDDRRSAATAPDRIEVAGRHDPAGFHDAAYTWQPQRRRERQRGIGAVCVGAAPDRRTSSPVTSRSGFQSGQAERRLPGRRRGNPVARLGDPGAPRNARRSTVALAMDPAAAQLVECHQGTVGQETQPSSITVIPNTSAVRSRVLRPTFARPTTAARVSGVERNIVRRRPSAAWWPTVASRRGCAPGGTLLQTDREHPYGYPPSRLQTAAAIRVATGIHGAASARPAQCRCPAPPSPAPPDWRRGR